MQETIDEAIQTGTIHSGNISFDLLRNIGGIDRDLWDELGRGRYILSSQDQLDQYLYSYGKMTKSQWGEFLNNAVTPMGQIRVIDYGCGQGLACSLLFDKFGSELLKNIKEVILIEPSMVALARAKSIVACYCRNATVVDINKKLDDLTALDLSSNEELSTLHLFSNVLDIDDFNYPVLMEKMFQKSGHHTVLAVSSDRNFMGGSGRFGDISYLSDDQRCRLQGSIITSDVRQFKCNDGMSAISWRLQLETISGSF